MSARKTAPNWLGRSLAVYMGGPLDPRWQFAEDVEQERRIEERMGRPTLYRRTGEILLHPWADATGAVWRRIR